jgi:hypothetical protein
MVKPIVSYFWSSLAFDTAAVVAYLRSLKSMHVSEDDEFRKNSRLIAGFNFLIVDKGFFGQIKYRNNLDAHLESLRFKDTVKSPHQILQPLLRDRRRKGVVSCLTPWTVERESAGVYDIAADWRCCYQSA